MRPISTLTLIDDDEIFVFLTKITIEQTKLVNKVRVFDNGLDAINFIRDNMSDPEMLPEIIFLDLSMPIMDGWQFLEQFTKVCPQLGRKITIYICSSSISAQDIERAKLISEVTDYIIKPLTKDKLVDVLNSL